jgi:transcriptional regulator with XRE-family HTH domain
MEYSKKEKLLELLVDMRRESGLTQIQVASLLGRPQSFVSKYESGERRLDILELLQLIEILNADPHRFLDELGRIND